MKYKINNLEASASDQHDAWSETKFKEGWVYGEVKDAEAKTHPCLVPYDELPVEQRAKDTLFANVVFSLINMQF